MKKLLSLFLILLCPATAHAEKYAYKNPDGTVRIADYQGGKDSLEDFLISVGIDPKKIVPIDDSVLPSKTDRPYWNLQGKSVVIDSVKKQAEIDSKNQLEAERAAVLSKLKISKEEFEKLNGIKKA